MIEYFYYVISKIVASAKNGIQLKIERAQTFLLEENVGQPIGGNIVLVMSEIVPANWRKYCINYVSPRQGLPLTKCPKQTASNNAENNSTFEIFTTKNRKNAHNNPKIEIFTTKNTKTGKLCF